MCDSMHGSCSIKQELKQLTKLRHICLTWNGSGEQLVCDCWFLCCLHNITLNNPRKSLHTLLEYCHSQTVAPQLFFFFFLSTLHVISSLCIQIRMHSSKFSSWSLKPSLFFMLSPVDELNKKGKKSLCVSPRRIFLCVAKSTKKSKPISLS